MRISRKNKVIITIVVLLAMPNLIWAQVNTLFDYSKYNPWPEIDCSKSDNCIFDLINKFLNYGITLAIPLIVIFIIYAGIILLISQGDKGKIQRARNLIWYSVLGFAVILIGKGFFLLIQSVLNLGAN